jgi:hypothetical protein
LENFGKLWKTWKTLENLENFLLFAELNKSEKPKQQGFGAS